MAPPENLSSATVTDLATARRERQPRSRHDATSATTAATTSGNDRADDTVGADEDDTDSEQDAHKAAVHRRAVRKAANRTFDAEKVARLKAAIADGRYTIDADSIADRFIEHERNS